MMGSVSVSIKEILVSLITALAGMAFKRFRRRAHKDKGVADDVLPANDESDAAGLLHAATGAEASLQAEGEEKGEEETPSGNEGGQTKGIQTDRSETGSSFDVGLEGRSSYRDFVEEMYYAFEIRDKWVAGEKEEAMEALVSSFFGRK